MARIRNIRFIVILTHELHVSFVTNYHRECSKSFEWSVEDACATASLLLLLVFLYLCAAQMSPASSFWWRWFVNTNQLIVSERAKRVTYANIERATESWTRSTTEQCGWMWKVRVSKRKERKINAFFFNLALLLLTLLLLQIWKWLNSKIILIWDMEFYRRMMYACVCVFDLNRVHGMKSVENKAKSVREVFTIGYVVFKYFKKYNSVCVLRQPR